MSRSQFFRDNNHSAMSFQHGTWRTIVNVGLHGIAALIIVNLHDIETSCTSIHTIPTDCTKPAFYPAFYGYSPQLRVTFHHRFCICTARWEGLVEALSLYCISTVVSSFYPLPLSRFLHRSFAIGLPLQTASPLNSFLMIHGIPGCFSMDDLRATTHLSRCTASNQVELDHGESPHRAPYVVLDQELPLGVIYDHIVWTRLPGPHVYRRLNDGLSLTGASYSQNPQILSLIC